MGRDLNPAIHPGKVPGFNPRARVGRDRRLSHDRSGWRWFQSTRPRGARQFGALDVGVHEVFQSTRPRGARRFLLQRRYILAGSFNPRARVGRDPGIDCSGIKVIGFQSTRPRGARQRWLHSWQVPPQFQSTRPRGARRQTLAFGKVASAVSIHAPAWGATFRYVFPLCNLGQFQSTRPRGARREIGGAFQGAPGFNPRARVGRDATRTGERPVLVWFQSTRPRGARRVVVGVSGWLGAFQSTRPRGARR